LQEEQGGLANEAAALELQQRNINIKAEQIKKLKDQEELLSKKEEFKLPGVSGKIFFKDDSDGNDK